VLEWRLHDITKLIIAVGTLEEIGYCINAERVTSSSDKCDDEVSYFVTMTEKLDCLWLRTCQRGWFSYR
jgi:hypothetical protein